MKNFIKCAAAMAVVLSGVAFADVGSAQARAGFGGSGAHFFPHAGGFHGGFAGRPVFGGYRGGFYRGRRFGVGPAVGLGLLGLGAAGVVGYDQYRYLYGDPCVNATGNPYRCNYYGYGY